MLDAKIVFCFGFLFLLRPTFVGPRNITEIGPHSVLKNKIENVGKEFGRHLLGPDKFELVLWKVCRPTTRGGTSNF